MRVTDYVQLLSESKTWNYSANGYESAAEPAAWAALALALHDHPEADRPALWLAKQQQANGAVGATQSHATPRWPTSLALLAWQLLDSQNSTQRYQSHIESARNWALNDRGRTGAQSEQAGHDTTLAGWSWAADTHSWLEPTCFFVKALTMLGLSEHPRVRVGRQMIVNRLLTAGGCNYGNTVVLGQELLPHLQPSGIAMWAIADHKSNDPRIEATLRYLERSVADELVTTASLSFALLGLTAHGRRPAEAARAVANKLSLLDPASSTGAYKLSLLLLAVLEQPNNVERELANRSLSREGALV